MGCYYGWLAVSNPVLDSGLGPAVWDSGLGQRSGTAVWAAAVWATDVVSTLVVRCERKGFWPGGADGTGSSCTNSAATVTTAPLAMAVWRLGVRHFIRPRT